MGQFASKCLEFTSTQRENGPLVHVRKLQQQGGRPTHAAQLLGFDVRDKVRFHVFEAPHGKSRYQAHGGHVHWRTTANISLHAAVACSKVVGDGSNDIPTLVLREHAQTQELCIVLLQAGEVAGEKRRLVDLPDLTL